MKRIVMLSVMAAIASLSVSAQDDLYFVPTKQNVEKSAADYGMPGKTYYSGSRRSIDDYNRMAPGSRVEPLDSAGNDVVRFDAVRGEYPDSTGDYKYTRRMSRFDDYSWYDPYWDGYYAGRASSWYMYDPWMSPWGYDAWYYGYPYSSWYGWYGYPYYGYSSWYWNDPWYWGGWYRPVYVVGGGYAGGQRRYGRSTFSGARGDGLAGASFSNSRGGRASYGGSYGSQRSYGRVSFGGQRSNSYGTFNNQRNSYQNNNYQMQQRSSFGSSSSSFGGGSFGGSRGGGSFGGGGSRGGGSFGGRR